MDWKAILEDGTEIHGPATASMNDAADGQKVVSASLIDKDGVIISVSVDGKFSIRSSPFTINFETKPEFEKLGVMRFVTNRMTQGKGVKQVAEGLAIEFAKVGTKRIARVGLAYNCSTGEITMIQNWKHDKENS